MSMPQLLTKQEAAERVRMAPATFVRLCGSGRGPALTRLGHRILVREDHLQTWIEANTQSTEEGRSA